MVALLLGLSLDGWEGRRNALFTADISVTGESRFLKTLVNKGGLTALRILIKYANTLKPLIQLEFAVTILTNR